MCWQRLQGTCLRASERIRSKRSVSLETASERLLTLSRPALGAAVGTTLTRRDNEGLDGRVFASTGADDFGIDVDAVGFTASGAEAIALGGTSAARPDSSAIVGVVADAGGCADKVVLAAFCTQTVRPTFLETLSPEPLVNAGSVGSDDRHVGGVRLRCGVNADAVRTV